MPDQDQMPLVSIGIPTFNRRKKLPISIESIYRQNYQNIEIIIADNCSSDDTQTYCESLMENDPRIRYIRQPRNLGPIPNWETVHKEAKGKYYIHMADDDWLVDGVIPKYVEWMEKNPDYIACSGNFLVMKTHDEISFQENEGFSESDDPIQRLYDYSSQVNHVGMYYGFMRRDAMKKTRAVTMLQHDWLIVMSVFYQGKVKALDFPGYKKLEGGISEGHWSQGYMQAVNATRFAANFPYLVTANKQFKDILFWNPIYKDMSFFTRLRVGYQCWKNIAKRFYSDPIKKSGRLGFDKHIFQPLKEYMRPWFLYKIFVKTWKLIKP